METKAISSETKSNLELLSNLSEIRQFYLAGGTACALYFGHRISYDLDFFSEKTFDVRVLEGNLRELGKLEVDVLEEKTFLGNLNNVKISFFFYPYQLIDQCQQFQQVNIANPKDLVAMKIDALQSRGTKRDFIDLFTILINKKWTISQALNFFQDKYKKANYNLGHVIKSLVYFNDADLSKEKLVLLKETDWGKIKQFFIDQIKVYKNNL